MADGAYENPVPRLYPGPPLSALRREWLRFILVGGMNTVFGYACYAACIYLGAGYALASAVSMIAGVLFGYCTNRGLVFRNAGGSLPRFVGCYAIVYLFAVTLLAQMDAAGVDPYLAGILVGAAAAPLSYLLLKLLVFRRRAER